MRNWVPRRAFHPIANRDNDIEVVKGDRFI